MTKQVSKAHGQYSDSRTHIESILMQRRPLLKTLSAWLTGVVLPVTLPATPALAAAPFPLTKTAAQWRAIVSPQAYAVLFEHGTERPGSSPLDREKRAGTFVCAACNSPLFDAAQKYDSRTG
jgi:peptide-methionine (R)-S-oxide reductase